MKNHPRVGDVWLLNLARIYGNDKVMALVLEVGPMMDKGCREVNCLILDNGRGKAALEGTTIMLTNGTFNAPNKRVNC